MPNVLLLLPYSKSWLFTLEDITPIIGLAIIVIILVALAVFFVKWYQYSVKKGFEEYEREHGTDVT